MTSIHQVLVQRPYAAEGGPAAAPRPRGEAAAALSGRPPRVRRAGADGAGAKAGDPVRVAHRQAGGRQGEGRRPRSQGVRYGLCR